jgi:hypothetical protein
MNQKYAVVISLFHALFGLGFKPVYSLLVPSSPIREGLCLWNEEGQQQQEEASSSYTRLVQLFEAQISYSLHERSGRQRWARKGK